MSSPSLQEVLACYSEAELQSRWQDLARAVRDSSPRRDGRELEPLPFVLDEPDWHTLEKGLTQRARLLNQLLEDAYGEQNLLVERRIPGALYFDNPLWVQPCLGQLNSEMARLLLYAADLIRDPEGNWWVLRDLTQCPSGFGWLLENRRWMARAYQEIFASHLVCPIAPSFQGLRQSLGELRQQAGGPRVVMLTPPAGSRHSMDDLALAQFLGCPLVEGEDLTVRGDTLYLKLLEGLQPLEVVLRRIPDRDCDPLEIPSTLGRGVVGLLQAVRAGNLAVTNSIGSGWLESPALAPLLADLCLQLEHQHLQIPSLGSPRAGEPAVYRSWAGGHTLLPPQQPSTGRWYAQRYQPTPWVLRCFVLYTPEGYQLVPGGLLRLPSRVTRDVWRWSQPGVATSESVRPDAPPWEISLSRGGGDIPSRVAEQFYWFGRYLERTESLLRLARQLLNRQALQGPEGCWKQLLDGRPEMLGGLVAWANGSHNDQLQSLLRHLHRLGEALRDRASADLPRALAALPLLSEPLGGGLVLGYLESLCVPIWALVAIARESLFRGYGFRFMEVGRRLERALQLTELLEPWLQKPAPSWDMLDLLLDVNDSGRTFRRRYPAGLHWEGVRDLLLGDDTHPRSLAFQLRSLGEHLPHLPNPERHQKQLDRVLEYLANQQWERLGTGLAEISPGLGSHYFTHVQPRALGAS